MTLAERIGLDLGFSPEAGQHSATVGSAGSSWVRVRFALRDRTGLDEGFLNSARAAVDALRAQGVRVLAVVDSDLTVAAGGAGAFAEPPLEPLASAWTTEFTGNVARLADALGAQVAAWEVLPAPNAGLPQRIAPGRWAALLSAVAVAIREHLPEAMIVSGGLVSDESDDGVEYLRAACAAAAESGLWRAEALPIDALGLQLALFPDGGPSAETVAAALGERTRRLWRVLESVEGTERATQHGVLVTGVGWDSARCGTEVQARNLWTALDTLTSDPLVHAVIWTSLLDSIAAATGLYDGADLSTAGERPAWRAFNDFAQYARQISPAAALMADVGPALPAGVGAVAVAAAVASVEPPPGGDEIVFRIPDAAEVLSTRGLEGAHLEAALAAVINKYGGYEWLPPGEYRITLPRDEPPAAPANYTNQQVISALYRAGDGTWSLFERSGLVLGELASRRNDPFAGPALESLGALTEAERQAVLRELQESSSAPPYASGS